MASSVPPVEQGLLLAHPGTGVQVHVVGTSHLAASHASLCQQTILDLRPATVVVELDRERFAQVDARLTALLRSSSSDLLPQHLHGSGSSFQDIRNEGGALLLGSVYGADMAGAALAAAAVGAELVLADRPQQETQARLQQMLQLLTQQAYAQCGAAAADGTSSSSMGHPVSQLLHTLQLGAALLAASLLTATQQLARAAGNWWHSSCSSDAQWYGRYVHPVFYLAGSPELQQQLQQQGVAGVAEAAAAARRLLAAAAIVDQGYDNTNSSSHGGSSSAAHVNHTWEQMQQDLAAIRRMVCSKEAVDLQQQQQHSDSRCLPSATPSRCDQPEGHSQKHPAQSLVVEEKHATSWGLLQPDAAHFFEASPFNPERAAYQQAVMHERDVLLTHAMWAAAEAAAVTHQGHQASPGVTRWLGHWSRGLGSGSEQPPPCVVAVVGANHLPGIAAEWAQRVEASQAAEGVGANWCGAGHGLSAAAVSDPAHAGDMTSWQREERVQQQQQQQQQEPTSMYATATGPSTWVPPAVAAGVEVGCVGAAGYALLKRWQQYHARQYEARATAAEGTAAAAAGPAWGRPNPASSLEQGGFVPRSGTGNHEGARVFQRLRRLLLGSGAAPTAFPPSTPAAAAAAAALHTAAIPASSAGLGAARLPLRLGLVLLPVAAAAWPLWQERRRQQEAVQLLQCVAAVNDDMLQHGSMTEATRELLQLAHVVSSRGPSGMA